MARHYVKILPWLEEWARRAGVGGGADWAKAAFQDLTGAGTAILTHQLPPNESGRLIALLGDKLWATAGIDKDRRDSLFISRLERSDARLPRQPPTRYDAQFVLVTQGILPSARLDDVDGLFGQVQSPPAYEEPVPATRLREWLASAPESLRHRWGPAAPSPGAQEAKQLVAALQDIWARHRLDRLRAEPRVTERQRAMLQGFTTPSALGEDERQGLLRVFGIGLLNALVFFKRVEPKDLYSVLDDTAGLPLAPAVRARVWAMMLAGCSPATLRSDLRGLADQLDALEAQPSMREEWTKHLAVAMSEVAQRHGDSVLQNLLEDAAYDRAPLSMIAGWARRLEVAANLEALPAAEARPLPAPSAFSEVGPPPPPRPEQVSALDTWALRLRVLEPEDVERLHARVHEWGTRLLNVSRCSPSARQVVEILRVSESVQADIAAMLRSAPRPDEIAADCTEAQLAYEEASGVLGEDLDPLLARRVSPSDLVEIAALVRQNELLAQAPPWLFSAGLEEADVAGRDRLVLSLAHPVVRRRLTSTVRFLETAPPAIRQAVAALPAPVSGEDPERYLDAELESLGLLGGLTAGRDEALSQWVSGLLASGSGSHAALAHVEALDRLKSDLPDVTLEHILSRVSSTHDLAEVRGLLNDYEAAVRAFKLFMGVETGLTVTGAQLDNWIANHAERTAEPKVSSGQLRFEHSQVGYPLRRAPLSFQPHATEPYGYLKAPVALLADQPRDLQIRLTVESTSKEREGWPATWDKPEPRELRIGQRDWRKTGDDTYSYAFPVNLPTRRPEGRVTMSLRGIDPVTDQVVVPAKELIWEDVVGTFEKIVLDWPDAIDARFVVKHPIGPQRHADKITERLASGSSVAVLAPRRFGKTTLLDHLRRLDKDSGVIAVGPINCLEFREGKGFDYQALWSAVSDRCQDRLGCGIDRSLERGLPRASAFDSVRRAARKKGAKSVALLFDEAQVLFPRSVGDSVGDRLKHLLEQEWGTPSDKGKALVAFTLVGLPSLNERAGVNLMGLLRPFEGHEIEEQVLDKLILAFTRGQLYSTREARLELARKSRNVFILKTLLDRLVDLASREARSWVSAEDVAVVERGLRSDLELGREVAVAGWVRDVLNDAETVNEWAPNPALVIAVALAVAKEESGRLDGDLYAKCSKHLESWCVRAASDGMSRPSYSRERFQEHLAILQERNVFDGGQFRSQLVESWLIGLARGGFPSDEIAVGALVRGAMMRVRTPLPLDPVDVEGGDAQIFTHVTDSGERLAVRRVPLRSDAERTRFQQSAEALSRLRDKTHLRESGSDYVFDLREIGLSADDDGVAVMVYRWVDGVDLESRVEQLAAGITADLGRRLALGLALLHRLGVLHRDIRPKNVVLSDEASASGGIRPVLIDFGLARLEGRDMTTQVGHQYSAPEVQGTQPRWSKAADIFSLGRMVAALVNPKDPNAILLQQALKPTQEVDPERRPSADELVRTLQELEQRLSVEKKRSEAWQRIRQHAGADLEKPWYYQILEKFRPRFESIELGLYPDRVARCAEVADFANQLLEAQGRGQSLGKIIQPLPELPETLRSSAVQTLHQLRRYRAHGSGSLRRQLNRSEAEVVADTLSACGTLGDYLGVVSLAGLARMALS